MWTVNESRWEELLATQRATSTVASRAIPHCVHQIWLGDAAIPPRFAAYMTHWRTLPNWEYRLWRDDDVATWTWHSSEAQKAYVVATNYGEKSDIFRLEVLYQCGGLYVDIDFERVERDDIDAHFCDASFVCGESNVGSYIELNNGLIAASSEHELVRFMLKTITEPWPSWGGDDVSQGEKVAFIMQKQQFRVPDGFASCVARTGPGFFTRAIFRYLMEHHPHDVKICPREVFYSKPNTHSEGVFCPPKDALAVHHWGKTWQTNSTSV
eukprot:GEMP01096150.1.p1 GENE.GEMP01096150.1~~GEMP01096150.1.p1  ORF type:complete len:284 (-),score=45.02 GEMP01096150.1:6-809(-)